jgi:hypothetical protein
MSEDPVRAEGSSPALAGEAARQLIRHTRQVTRRRFPAVVLDRNAFGLRLGMRRTWIGIPRRQVAGLLPSILQSHADAPLKSCIVRSPPVFFNNQLDIEMFGSK